MGLFDIISSVLTGGLSNVIDAVSPGSSDVVNSFTSLGNSDVFTNSNGGFQFNPMDLGKSAFQWTDDRMGTGSMNQDIGNLMNMVALAYGGGSAASGLGSLFGAGGDAAASGTGNLMQAGAGAGDYTGMGSLAYDGGSAVAPTISTAAPTGTGGMLGGSSGSLLADTSGALPSVAGGGADVVAGGVPQLADISGSLPTIGANGAGMGVGADATGGGGGGILSSLMGGAKSALPYTMLGGTLLNAAGNYMGANQQNQNNQNFQNAAAWTPERINALTSGLETSVGNVYNKNAAEKKESVASNLAELGKAGGAAAQSSFQIDEANREAKANAVQSGLLSSGAYTPPGLLTGASSYQNQNPYAQSMTGASGVLGNISNAYLMSKLLGSSGSSLFGG